MYQVVNNLSHQAGAHALRAGVDFIYNDDTITFPRSIRGIVRVLVAREFSGRHLQRVRLHADVRRHRRVADQSEPRRLRAGRVEGEPVADAQCRGCATTCSSWRRSTPTRTTFRRGSASPGRRPTRGGPWCAAAPGCSSIVCRCARSRTRCCRRATRPI